MAAQIKSFDTIKTNKIFRKVPAGDIKIKVSSNNYIEKKEGDIVFQSGDPGDFIYLILSGDVKMKLPTLSGPRIEKRGAEDFFGEIEFFEGTARTSSAVAETDCIIYPLSRKEVNDLITKNRTILNNLQNVDESGDQSFTPVDFGNEVTSLSHFDEEPEPEPEPEKTEPAAQETDFNEPEAEPFAEEPHDDAFFSTGSSDFSIDDFEAKLDNVKNIWSDEPAETTTPDSHTGIDSDIDLDELHKEFSFMNESASSPLEIETEIEEHGSDIEEHEHVIENLNQEIDAPKQEIDEINLPVADHENKPAFNFASFKNIEQGNEPAYPSETAYQPEEETHDDENLPDFSSWDFSGNISDEEKNEIDRLIEIETPAKFSDIQMELSSPTEFNELDGIREIEDFPVPPEISEKLDKELAESEFAEVERLVPETPVSFDLPLPDEKELPAAIQPAATKNGLTADQLHLIVRAAEKVNSNIKLDDVLNSIVEVASELTNADRGTLYLIDEEQNELWSKVIQGLEAKEIRLKIGQGLAGSAAETNEIVNVPDASLDDRFNPGFDMATGYVTKSVLCFPIKNRDGKAIGVLQLINSKNGVFSKMDEQFLEALSINAAIALENAELIEQLLRTDRLTSLGKMAGFILQDIKKPIITIKHFAEHIKKKQVPPDIKQVLEMQIEQANAVVNLVQTTLSYSEGKSILQSQVQSLNQVLDTVLLMLAEYVESQKVKLFKKYDKDVLVSVDKNEFYQACYQITKNACEAMPNGGNLYFSTQIVDDGVQISIRDTGLGIPDSIKERIFEPFMSHGKKQGTGLGLSITEKIIKDHRGTVSVESNLGEGTTFFILLPIARKL